MNSSEPYRRKASRIPEEIMVASNNNPIVRQCVEMYCTGQIVMLEEALCQMVVQLCKNWGDMERRAYEAYAALTMTTVLPAEK